MNWAINQKGLSQRRACDLAGIDPRVYRYRSRRPDDDVIRKRLRELAAERRRFGYRRLHIMLTREGFHLNRKKLYRLYKEERLTVRKTRWSQACPRHTVAHDDPARGQSALEPGLCL